MKALWRWWDWSHSLKDGLFLPRNQASSVDKDEGLGGVVEFLSSEYREGEQGPAHQTQ